MEVMENIRLVLRTNLRRLREERRWSQSDLAENSKLSEGMVKNIELGNRWPSPATAEAIAEALRVPIGALFGENTQAPKSISIKDALVLASSVPDSFWNVVQEHEMTEEVWAALGDAIAGAAKKKRLSTTKEA
jgi:transcriptional regulator with XRE-family HTH domain